MSSFGDDPIKDLGFVVFPASAGLDQRDCLFCAFSLHLWQTSMSLKIPWRTPMRGWMKSIGCC